MALRSIGDFLFYPIIVIHLTSLFRVLAPLGGTSVAAVSAGLCALVALYAAYRVPTALKLIRARAATRWLVLLLLWPLASLLYAPALDLRVMGLLIYEFLIVLTTVTFVLANGWWVFHRIVGLALLLSVVGLILSRIAPDAFQAAAQLTGERVDQGRAFGFFLQPNRAGAAFTLMFVVWWLGAGGRRATTTLAAVVSVLVLTGLTGSRGSLFVALCASALTVTLVLRERARVGKVRLSRSLRTAGISVVLITVVGAAFTGVRFAADRLSTSESSQEVGRRLASVTAPEGWSTVLEQQSVAARLAYQAQYVDMLGARPWTGYGLGAATYFQRRGVLLNSSHIVFLEVAFEFGIFYSLSLLVAVASLGRLREAVRGPACDANTMRVAFALIVLALSMFSNTVMTERTFLVLLGGIVASDLLERQQGARMAAAGEGGHN